MTPDAVVDVDIALPGRDALPGVASPDREPLNWFGRKHFYISVKKWGLRLRSIFTKAN